MPEFEYIDMDRRQLRISHCHRIGLYRPLIISHLFNDTQVDLPAPPKIPLILLLRRLPPIQMSHTSREPYDPTIEPLLGQSNFYMSKYDITLRLAVH